MTRLLITLMALVAAGLSSASEVLAAPACTDPGAKTPVLFVHGLASDASVFDSGNIKLSSVVKELDAVVDRFDYHAVAKKWVTNPLIGQALAERIVCLADRSRSAGGPGKVIVIVHSMGGLALRQAADMTRDGSKIASRVALAVTVATPHRGSWLEGALTANTTGAISGAVFKAVYGGARLLCQGATPPGVDAALTLLNADLCGILSDPAGEAALAMRPDSDQLKALPALPNTLPVLAAAGEVRLVANLFGEVVPLGGDVGDLVVRTNSATAFAGNPDAGGGTVVRECDMDAYEIATGLGWNYCTHGGLLSDPEVNSRINSAIRTALARLRPVKLAADGLGVAKFGDPADAALASLTAALGEPDYLGPWATQYCATGEGGGGRLAVWGNLQVIFNDAGVTVGTRDFPAGQRALWGYDFGDSIQAYDQGTGQQVSGSRRILLTTPSGIGLGSNGNDISRVYGAKATFHPGDPDDYPGPSWTVTAGTDLALYLTVDANRLEGRVITIGAGRGCGE